MDFRYIDRQLRNIFSKVNSSYDRNSFYSLNLYYRVKGTWDVVEMQISILVIFFRGNMLYSKILLWMIIYVT